MSLVSPSFRIFLRITKVPLQSMTEQASKQSVSLSTSRYSSSSPSIKPKKQSTSLNHFFKKIEPKKHCGLFFVFRICWKKFQADREHQKVYGTSCYGIPLTYCHYFSFGSPENDVMRNRRGKYERFEKLFGKCRRPIRSQELGTCWKQFMFPIPSIFADRSNGEIIISRFRKIRSYRN